jgi:hypothetical protein
MTGRARNFKLVHFDGSPELVGRLVPVLITAAGPASLQARAEPWTQASRPKPDGR